VTEGQTLSVQAIVSDVDLPAQELTFGLGAGAPAGATIDPVTGEFSWTPPAGSAGQVTVTIEVADSAEVSLSDSVTFMVEVVQATSLEAFGQSLATSTRSVSQPIVPPRLPIDYAMIDLATLVNEPTYEASTTPPPNPVSDFANVGSGGSGSSSSSGDSRNSENTATTVFKPVDGEESDGDGKRSDAGDEDEQNQDRDSGTPGGEGASAETIDEAISQLLAEMASDSSG